MYSDASLLAIVHKAQENTKAPKLDGPTPSNTALGDLLRKIYAEGYLSGVKAAADSANVDIKVIDQTTGTAGGINWDTWKPGNPEAASLVADGGLQDLLDSADLVLQGITDTTVDELGNVLSRGLGDGLSPDSIARMMRDYLDGDNSRAEIIATTELNRAQTQAQGDELQGLGFDRFEWIAYDSACEICSERDGNVFMWDDPMPPEHPMCRCSIVGNGSIAEDN